ncbi:hypothetical protein J3Q64DRAFT_1667379 [Phycomyces blakesleeanus]|uniref:MIT domain-containing protein n=2 Tax=Phycomyces blakesleeanus TaxID=4837 RepID=A0A162ZEZ2_PHYB8|nr:hypothetical protein PHYBLDRAFT_183920 [Phycomyces blakesleeanus NRRL 1555(-)]OAD66321.1 hypothetical protein PHYBLDRAFT_183920 [Phycomyces blakesleeanus NRRL 1555(-)]|eukprot:XP_018284361.1 hypothetical protein PHYBLDRAFT_183920 [Phycomyces blakesleeanus NRRL 1555(-)]
MSILVSRVLSHADKLPIVGSPRNSISSWLPISRDSISSTSSNFSQAPPNNRRRSVEQHAQYEQSRISPPNSPRIYASPPPPYENVVSPAQQQQLQNKPSTFNKLSGYLKRASFSAGYSAFYDSKPAVPLEVATIDKKQVEHALTLINVATEMDNTGNHEMAIDLYLMGLDKMISSLPIESNPAVKAALEQKLIEFAEAKNLNLSPPVPTNHHQHQHHHRNPARHSRTEEYDDNEEDEDRKQDTGAQFSSLIVNAAILGAVALKKSPLPDAISCVVNTAISGAQKVDENYQISKRTWDLAGRGVAKAIQIDRDYELHQMVSDAVCTSLTAAVKAGLAYVEAPGYYDTRRS